MTELYLRHLSRQPEQAGLDSWTGHLDQDNLTRYQVVLAFVRSEESLRNLVRAWFQNYLGRPATSQEIENCAALLRNGASHRTVQIKIIASPEYFNSPSPPDQGEARRL